MTTKSKPDKPRPRAPRIRQVLMIRQWGFEAENALAVVQEYLWQVLHIADRTNRAVAWAVRTLAAMLRAHEETGRLELPGMAPGAPPPGLLPEQARKSARDRIVVSPWPPSASTELDYLHAWTTEHQGAHMTPNQCARWAVLTLADMMRAAYAGKEVRLPT